MCPQFKSGSCISDAESVVSSFTRIQPLIAFSAANGFAMVFDKTWKLMEQNSSESESPNRSWKRSFRRWQIIIRHQLA